MSSFYLCVFDANFNRNQEFYISIVISKMTFILDEKVNIEKWELYVLYIIMFMFKWKKYWFTTNVYHLGVFTWDFQITNPLKILVCIFHKDIIYLEYISARGTPKLICLKSMVYKVLKTMMSLSWNCDHDPLNSFSVKMLIHTQHKEMVTLNCVFAYVSSNVTPVKMLICKLHNMVYLQCAFAHGAVNFCENVYLHNSNKIFYS